MQNRIVFLIIYTEYKNAVTEIKIIHTNSIIKDM